MNFNLEKNYGEIIVGIDEVGRGTLAGPVLAAAIYINRSKWNNYLKKYLHVLKHLPL